MPCKLDPALQPNSRFQASRIQFRFSRPTKNSAPLSDPDMETQQYHAIPCIMAPQLCQKQSKIYQELGLLCLGQGYLSYLSYPILSYPYPYPYPYPILSYPIHPSIYLSMHLSIGCTYLYTYLPFYLCRFQSCYQSIHASSVFARTHAPVPKDIHKRPGCGLWSLPCLGGSSHAVHGAHAKLLCGLLKVSLLNMLRPVAYNMQGDPARIRPVPSGDLRRESVALSMRAAQVWLHCGRDAASPARSCPVHWSHELCFLVPWHLHCEHFANSTRSMAKFSGLRPVKTVPEQASCTWTCWRCSPAQYRMCCLDVRL